MDTSNLWKEISNLKGRTLKTLDRCKEFEIQAVSESSVIVLPRSTGKPRPIMRTGIENAWQHLVSTGRITPIEIEDAFSSNNSAYVSALLASLSGVIYSTKPIELKLPYTYKQK